MAVQQKKIVIIRGNTLSPGLYCSLKSLCAESKKASLCMYPQITVRHFSAPRRAVRDVNGVIK